MKRRILFLFLSICLLCSFLVSCKEDKIDIGRKEAEFTHCELTLVLDDSFTARESEDFDLLVSNGEIAVSLIRITFEAGFLQGISDTYTAKGFAAFFMNKSGKSTQLLMRGDVPYYNYTEKTEGGNEIFYTVTFYRSLYAYFTVAYAVPYEKRNELSEKVLGYAEAAYFNDAPIINQK